MNILLKISYDGTNYSGSSKQNNAITIQSEIERALSLIYKEDISLTFAGRTDAGVHSLGQRAAFKTLNERIPISNIPHAINSKLNDDIVITDAIIVPDEFHPRFDAVKKIYQYKINNDSYADPILRKYMCFERRPLDISVMKQAGAHFIGTHDFKAFSSAKTTAKTTVRTIFDLTVEKHDNIITITVIGNGFLYNMVRIISGTLIYVGLGKINQADIANIILNKDRSLAGKTAPPHGLVLLDVIYNT